MAEMSLERACEILNGHPWRGVATWKVQPAEDGLDACVANSSHISILTAEEAVIIASHLERDAAPPADAGEGGTAYAAALRLVADALDDAAASDLPSIAVSQADLEQIREALLAAAERGNANGGLRSQVLALADLKDGWHDGEGGTCDRSQLEAVVGVLDRLAAIDSGRVYPTPQGRVRVEWGGGPVDDSLEIDPHTLAMRMHLYDLDSETIVGEIAPESLLAAAERGGGPGPATRKVLEAFVRPDYPDWEGLAMVNVAVWRDTKGGETITFDDLRAARRECGMTEAPR